MNDSITVRPYEPGDEDAICAAMAKVRSQGCELEDWAWSHPPLPAPRRIATAWRGAEVIAHAAATPVAARINAEPATILRCLDSVCCEGAAQSGQAWSRTVACFEERFLRSPGPTLLLELESDAPSLAARIDAGAATSIAPAVLRRSASRGRPTSLRRLAYRLDLARDWEPGLDVLWSRAGHAYPTSANRDAAHSLARLSGHPRVHHHRFLVFPRLSATPVAFAAFTTAGECCRWVDLVWDRDHPGAIELLARVSARLAAMATAGNEEVWIAGDDVAVELLEKAGFSRSLVRGPTFTVRAVGDQASIAEVCERLYLTMADAAPLSTGASGSRMTEA